MSRSNLGPATRLRGYIAKDGLWSRTLCLQCGVWPVTEALINSGVSSPSVNGEQRWREAPTYRFDSTPLLLSIELVDLHQWIGGKEGGNRSIRLFLRTLPLMLKTKPIQLLRLYTVCLSRLNESLILVWCLRQPTLLLALRIRSQFQSS